MTNNIYKGATSVKVTERVETCMYALRACNKTFKRAAMIALAGLVLAGCANDTMTQGDAPTVPADDAAGYYITLNVTTPDRVSTRGDSTLNPGGTSSGGTLAGTDPETSLVSATLYFLDSNNSILCSATDFKADYIDPVSSSGTTQMRIKIDDIEALADLAGKRVRIVVVGNTTDASNQAIYTPDVNSGIVNAKFPISGVTASPIGDFGENGKLMPLMSTDSLVVNIPKADGVSNVDAVKAMFSRFTPTIAWWDVNSSSNPVQLERGVARLEYKDREDRSTDSDDMLKEDHVYKIGNLGVYIKLHSMTPFNVAKESYLFRHTAAGTLSEAGNTISVFGTERANADAPATYTWVATPWWESRTTKPTFHNKLTITETSYEIVDGNGEITISDLYERTPTEEGGYYPWCYVSENTVDSVARMNEARLADYATGVAFKFEVLGTDGNPLQFEEEVPATGSLYPTEVSNSTDHPDDEAIFIMDQNDYWIEVMPETDENDVNHYYVTYIACLVHNDGKQKAEGSDHAPMFYGVVRNNTYQMKVTGINGLPIPQEPRTLYLRLDVRVLPWTVRHNDIVF